MDVKAQSHVVILGCGFTGRRVANRLLSRGCRVTAATRRRSNLAELAAAGAEVIEIDPAAPHAGDALAGSLSPGCLVLHSLPSIPGGSDQTILEGTGTAISRVVYLSTTGVYGAAHHVNEKTPPSPRNARERARVATENAILQGPWESLILRPAAIYGPGRGVHVSLRAGTFRLGLDSTNYISRIHVEDLAGHAEAALFSGVTGAYPVADEYPCPSAEIAAFCAALLGVAVPEPTAADEIAETRRANRRVDGSAIRALLGIRLLYPSYREGIPACLEAEGKSPAMAQEDIRR